MNKHLSPVGLTRTLRLTATAALAFLLPAALHGQAASDAYQGVSRPPADDVIETSSDPVPAPAKPSAGVTAAQPRTTAPLPASSTPAPVNSENPDYGIVGDRSPVTDQADRADAPPRVTHLIARPENPDYDIVGMVPSPANQLPEGTDISVRLMQNLNTSTTQDGVRFRGQVAANVYKDGRVVIPVGSELRGRVLSVTQGHRLGTPATLRLRPEAIMLPDGTSYHLYAQAIHTDAPGTRTDSEGGIQPSSRMTKNLVELGAGSGGGAATGAVLAGPAGAAAGALVGAGIITAHLLLQQPHEARVEQGSEITFSLTEPMDLVPMRN